MHHAVVLFMNIDFGLKGAVASLRPVIVDICNCIPSIFSDKCS